MKSALVSIKCSKCFRNIFHQQPKSQDTMFIELDLSAYNYFQLSVKFIISGFSKFLQFALRDFFGILVFTNSKQGSARDHDRVPENFQSTGQSPKVESRKPSSRKSESRSKSPIPDFLILRPGPSPGPGFFKFQSQSQIPHVMNMSSGF